MNVVAPHIRPTSPFILKRQDGSMHIIDERNNNILTEVEYLPRPEIWDIKLSDGSYIKKYLNVYGANCLNLFIVANCDFWSLGKPCVFCSLQPTQQQHKEVIVNKQLKNV